MSGEDYLTFASEDAIISFDKFSRNEESNRNSKNKKNCDDVRKSNERSPLLRRFPSLQSARPSFRRISTSFRKLSCLKKDEDEDMPMLEVPRHKSIDIGVGLARRVSLFLFTRRTVCLHPYHPYTPVQTTRKIHLGFDNKIK